MAPSSITIEIADDRQTAAISVDDRLTHMLSIEGRSWVLRSLACTRVYGLPVASWRLATRPVIEAVIGEAVGAVLAAR